MTSKCICAVGPQRLTVLVFLVTVITGCSSGGGGDDGGGGNNSTPPTTTITAQPLALTNSTDASFSFQSDDPASSFECLVDGGSFENCASPKSYMGVAEGAHTFCVRARNSSGADPGPPCAAWTVDTTAPTNTSSVNFIDGGNEKTGNTTVTLHLSATDNVGVAAYFVVENETGIPPAQPVADDPGWATITSTTAFDSSVAYAFQAVHFSDTKVHLFIFFKDGAGNVTAPVSREFFDDFETGSLGNWTIAGRRAAGSINIAEVVTRDNSKKAHLRHDDFTEINLEKTFPYNTDTNFMFQMETAVFSQASGTSDFHALGGVFFDFLDSTGTVIGRVVYARGTSSFWFNVHCSGAFTDPAVCHLNRLTGPSVGNHSHSMAELLAQISVSSPITAVKVIFNAYASGWIYNMSSDVWLDDFAVIKTSNGWDAIVYDVTP